MTKIFRTGIRWLRSDNPKSKIQNLKWGGFVTLVITFAMCGAVAAAQQPKKVPRIGYLVSSDSATYSNRSEAIRLAARAWLQRKTEHRHRVPIRGGEARSVACACSRPGAPQG